MRKENIMHYSQDEEACIDRYRGNPYDVHPCLKVLMNTCWYRVNKCETQSQLHE